MASISLQTLTYSLAAPVRNLVSTKAEKPVGNSAWLKCGKNVLLSFKFQTNQGLRTIQCRVIKESIEYIKDLLTTTGDGRISVSPYDTAWAALIKSLDGRDLPEFPSTMKWIAQNQLSDVSLDDEYFFCAYARLVNTLARVVALTSPDKSEKGIRCIRDNVDSLKDANVEHMTCGFKVVVPALLQKTQSMGIPYEAPVVRETHEAREQKIKR